jgi:NADH-quinone oxidoreductase subunit E
MAVQLSHSGKTHSKRKDLVPLLQKVQETERYLSPESIRLISRHLRISESEVYGVATFYAQFRFRPPGDCNIKVCLGTACHVGGGNNFMEVMKIAKNLSHGETSPDRKFSLERVACLGCCALAPVVVVNEEVHGRMNRVKFMKLLDSLSSSGKEEESLEAAESAE